jgi:hypothetical protein
MVCFRTLCLRRWTRGCKSSSWWGWPLGVVRKDLNVMSSVDAFVGKQEGVPRLVEEVSLLSQGNPASGPMLQAQKSCMYQVPD